MELREYWSILRRWLWLIILGTFLAAGITYVVNANTQPIYQSTVTLRVDPSTGRSTNEYAGLLVAEQLTGTYSQQIRMRPVMEGALELLGMQHLMSPEQLAAMVSVSPVRDTQLIRVSVQNPDPVLAAEMANEIAKAFIKDNQEFEQSRFADSKASLSAELVTVRQDMELTEAAIQALETAETPEDDPELDRLQLTLASQQAAYSNLLSSYEELRIAEASESSNIVKVEDAIPEYSPVRPRTRSNTMLAAAVGALVAVGIIFLIEYLDDTIKSPDDVTSVVGLSTLGAIAHIEGKLTKEKLVTLLAPRSPISEAYRALRTNIQFAAVDGPLKSIVVTSSGPGEGKSTTAANLAIVLAQAGRRVIIVDADLRRPVQHRIFELPNGQGLTTALLDLRTPVIQHVQATGVPGLQVMTSGAIPPNPAELLGSQRLSDLLAGLEQEVDTVILDSPPVLTVADALVLAPQVHGVLLVVEAGSTRREMLRKAAEALAHAEARVLGIALNLMTPRRSGYYYQYYQYYYSQYEKESARSSRRSRFLPGLKR